MLWTITAIVAIVAAVLAALRFFKLPFKLIVRLALNTGAGLAALMLLDMTKELTGIALGVNLFSALVVGILGLPGFALLLLLKLIFT